MPWKYSFVHTSIRWLTLGDVVGSAVMVGDIVGLKEGARVGDWSEERLECVSLELHMNWNSWGR